MVQAKRPMYSIGISSNLLLDNLLNPKLMEVTLHHFNRGCFFNSFLLLLFRLGLVYSLAKFNDKNYPSAHYPQYQQLRSAMDRPDGTLEPPFVNLLIGFEGTYA
jgi:hypothetical protein